MAQGGRHLALAMLLLAAVSTGLSGCGAVSARPVAVAELPGAHTSPAPSAETASAPPERESARARRVALAAMAQVGKTVSYDARYIPLPYPGGDVSTTTGVCSDVVIRAYRAVGVDLQVKVHEDMVANFSAYPQRWGLSRPDSNIDHRRVPNLQTYFSRHGASRRVTDDPGDYWPGDLVVWSVNGLPHIGVVSTRPAPGGTRFMVAHNIGAGTQVEDVLFAYAITGHYRSF